MSGRRHNQRREFPTDMTRKILNDEQENDSHLNHLHAQVSSLRNITIEIGNEVRDQNALLDGMGLAFDRTGSLLSQTMRNLKSLVETEKGRGYVLYTAIFFAAIFLFIFLRAMF